MYAMPRESFVRTFWRRVRAQCTVSLFATRPETEPERRLRLARAGAELAEHLLEFTDTERAPVIARALSLANVPVTSLPATDPFQS